MEDGNSVTTKLLTLLNVSATKIGKRKRVEDDFVPSEKLNKRKSITFDDSINVASEKPDVATIEAEITMDNAEETLDIEEATGEFFFAHI